jgi:hypothetical protein
MWLFVRMGNPQGWVEGPVNLLVGIVILPENIPQEHQLRMKAVLVTQSSSPLYQSGKYGMLVGWVVMRARVQVKVVKGRFMVHSMAQGTIGSPVNIYVKEGKVAISFHLHGELNVLVDTVQVVKEVPQPIRAVWPDDESVIHIAEPAEGLVGSPVKRHPLKSYMKKLLMTGDSGQPMATPSICS